MGRFSVAVVFGGRSVEHDVSIVTAHQVMAALADRYDVVPVYVTKEGSWLSSPALNDLSVYREGTWAQAGRKVFIPPVPGSGLVAEGTRLKPGRTISVDVVVPAIHGTFGEDGTLQGVLELAGIPYVGSGVTASAVGMDKVAMKAAFAAAGLPVVPHSLVEADRLDADGSTVIDGVERAIGYPAFVKPSRLGSSVGISKADDRASLEGALEVARRYDRRIVVEPAMQGCLEINCSVLGGPGRESRASVCEQPVAWQEFLSFEDKYLRGGKTKPGGMASQERRIPAPISEQLTKQVQENAIAAFRAIDACGVARVDAFVREETNEAWVMEINTVPGSFSFYLWEATGLPFAALLDELVEIALTTHRSRSELLFTFDSGILDRPGGQKIDG